MTNFLVEWKGFLEEEWRGIPKAYRNDQSVRRTLQCSLFGAWRKTDKGVVVADYRPPRVLDRLVDLITLNSDGTIDMAVCLDSVVTLAAVKSLSSFEAAQKGIITTGLFEKKVQESLFFLKPDIQHLHLQPFEKPF